MNYEGWHDGSHHAPSWPWSSSESDAQLPWTDHDEHVFSAAPVADQAWYAKGRPPTTSTVASMRTAVSSLKTPPRMEPHVTWFDYEKILRDWAIVAEVDAKKKGTLLKFSLDGANETYINQVDTTNLQGEDGANYFLETLRPYFVKGSIQTFLCRFLLLNSCRRGNSDFKEWLLRLEIRKSEAVSSWMELAPDKLSLDNPVVLQELRAASQETFGLRQANPNLPPEEAVAGADALVNMEMLPLLVERLAAENEKGKRCSPNTDRVSHTMSLPLLW